MLLINKPETKYTIHIHNEPLMEPSSYAWQRAGELQRANSATTEPASNLQTSLIRSNSIPQQCTGMEGSRGESSLDSLRTAGGQHHGGDSQPTMLLLCGAPGSGTVQLMFICAWPRLHTLWGMASSGIMCCKGLLSMELLFCYIFHAQARPPSANSWSADRPDSGCT